MEHISYTFLLNDPVLENFKFVRAIESNFLDTQDLIHDLIHKVGSPEHISTKVLHDMFESVDSLNIDWSKIGWCDLNINHGTQSVEIMLSIYGLENVLMCTSSINVNKIDNGVETSWSLWDGFGMESLDTMEDVLKSLEKFTHFPNSLVASELVKSTYIDLKNMIDIKINKHLNIVEGDGEDEVNDIIAYEMLPTFKLEYWDTDSYDFKWCGYTVWSSETDTLPPLENGESQCDLFFQQTMYDIILENIRKYNTQNQIKI